MAAQRVAVRRRTRRAQLVGDAVQAAPHLAARFVVAAGGPQQVAVLPLDPRLHQRLGQAQAGGLVGQGAVLPQPPLHLAGRGRQAGGVVAGRRQPVDADAVLDALAQRLRRHLGEAVQQQHLDAADGVLALRLVARPHHQGVAADADLGGVGHDVQRRAVAVRREEADRVAFGLAVLAHLLRQADGGQRAAGAEAFVVGDRRPVGRFAQAAGLGDGAAQVVAGGVIDRDADGDVGGVVADAALADRLGEGLLQQDGVGDDLEAVRGPGFGRGGVVGAGPAAFVLVGQQAAVAAAQAVDLAGQAPGGAGQFDADGLAVLVGFEGGVELPPGVDGGVGDTQFLDLFEVEEARTVGEGVQGHHPHERGVTVEDGQ